MRRIPIQSLLIKQELQVPATLTRAVADDECITFWNETLDMLPLCPKINQL